MINQNLATFVRILYLFLLDGREIEKGYQNHLFNQRILYYNKISVHIVADFD